VAQRGGIGLNPGGPDADDLFLSAGGVAQKGGGGVHSTAEGARARFRKTARRLGGLGRAWWVDREKPEGAARLRWAAAALLVLVGVISTVVVPRASATVSEPTFDSRSVSPAADPPGLPTPTASGPAAAPSLQIIPVPLPLKPMIPVGKGMWLHRMEKANNGDAASIVNQAVTHGLSHLYVRLGSSRMGFYGQGDLNKLLPVAHAAGLKVVGWDFPYLRDVPDDANRAAAEMAYATPDGHRIDAFAADIETPSEGTNLTTVGVDAYGRWVRIHAGPRFPLILAVPRPNPKRWYPYAEAAKDFDAIAPMVYWVNRDPGADVAGAIQALAPLGKPVIPVGQAYDPGIDGSHSWGPPSAADINKFMQTAADLGVASYSFWVWDTASAEQWQAIGASQLLHLQPLAGPQVGDRVAALQRVLKGLGQPVAVDGDFGAHTKSALAQLQRQLGIPVTGRLDAATLQALKQPLK
jgi:hypothetical protein